MSAERSTSFMPIISPPRHPEVSWADQHRSLIYLTLLAVSAACCFFTGNSLEEYKYEKLAHLVTEFGITMAVAVFVGVFLSLRDVKENIARALTTVLSGDDGVTLLSEKTKTKLRNALMLDHLTFQPEPKLYEHLTDLSEKIFSSVYVTNFTASTRITPRK